MPAAAPTPRHQLPLRRGLVIALVCLVLLAGLDVLGAFRFADLKLLDWKFQLRGPRPASDAIALVEIDDATIAAYGGHWPLPREIPAGTIGALGEAGARAIGLDLLFLGPDACNPLSDSMLVLATSIDSTIVHAIAFPPGSLGNGNSDPAISESLLAPLGLSDTTLPAQHAGKVATPFPRLLAESRHVGHVSVAFDGDGVIRRVPLLLRYGDRLYPSLALSLVQVGFEHGHAPGLHVRTGGYDLSWGPNRSLFVPVDGEGATAIDFAGDRSAFPNTYSMFRVNGWSLGGHLDSLRDAFHGKVVIIGATSIDHVATDLGTTPFTAATPLVYVHLNLLDALLRDRLLFHVPAVVRFVMLVLMAALVTYFAVLLSLAGALAVAVGTTIVFAGINYWMFLQGVDFPPMAGLLVAPLVYTAVQSYRVGYEERRALARAKELAIAAKIQRGLLPQAPPRHPALEVHGINVPAQEVGGDYYDWLPTGDGRIAVALGDVAGKGIGAALLMAHLHSSFHKEARSSICPRDTVDAMHRSLHEAADSRQFATFFLATIDGTGRTLRYCNAGHNPPILVRGNRVESLGATGLPLGMILDGPAYEDRELALQSGDVLVIYSDGITEYPFRNDMYGETRLAATVVRMAQGRATAAAIVNGILDDIRDFAHGGPADDDVTIVVVVFSPEGFDHAVS